ncbi:hypothetical protein SDC9_140138 [bioreactor metagenome]|uniref:Uncharacterized protein n=1 Tax=bioreactor metagenome TaxID=1076179 RepID=A0A645DXE7_9ZZZZ
MHHLAHGHGRALGGHHGGRAHFKYLQDVRCAARAERCNGGGHGFVVGALVGRDDLEFLLAFVELFGQIVDPFIVHGSHGVPPLNFSLCLGSDAGGRDECCHCQLLDPHWGSYG